MTPTDLEKSINFFTRATDPLEIDPNYPNALWFLGLSLEQKGDRPKAIEKLEKAVGLSDGLHYRAVPGRAYALAGERKKAL